MRYYMAVYTALGMGSIATRLLRGLALVLATLRASSVRCFSLALEKQKKLEKIVYAPTSACFLQALHKIHAYAIFVPVASISGL